MPEFWFRKRSEIVPQPTVTNVAPNVGSTMGGTAVVITGANLTNVHVLRFGDVDVPFVIDSDSQITATTSAQAEGEVDITLIRTNGRVTVVDAFEFAYLVPAPQVTAVSPNIGASAGGTPVTIEGEDFVNGATVSFGGSPASSVVWVDAQTITCVTPAGSVGAEAVKVVNPDSQEDTLAAAFTYSPPVVNSVTPNTGATAGGTSVTIDGEYFSNPCLVYIGGVAATSVVRVNAETITCVTPGGSSGAADVLVMNSDVQSGTLVGGFTYSAGSAPVLTSLNYTQGDTLGGGQSIVMTASGGGLTGYTPRVDGVAIAGGSYTVDSDTQITFALPAHAAGTVNVDATGPNGTSNALSFEYWDPTEDPDLTRLQDSISHPYVATGGTSGRGSWPARFSVVATDTYNIGLAGNHPASGGAPVFDGDASVEAGLIDAGCDWADFLSAPGADIGPGAYGHAGSIAHVTTSTTSTQHMGTAPYANPGIVGYHTVGAGCGIHPSTLVHQFSAHIYSGVNANYCPVYVDAASGVKHAVVARWTNVRDGTTGVAGPGVIDLSVDGALTGAGYASLSINGGTDHAYSGGNIALGVKYPASSAAEQVFAGSIHAYAILRVPASDTFVTKFHKWSQQRFGVA